MAIAGKEKMAQQIAFVLKGYPRLSETFIAQEIRALEDFGLVARIYSLRHPTDHLTHPVHGEIRAAVDYLPEYLKDAPGRVLAGVKSVIALPGFRPALAIWWRDLMRDPTPNRIRRFGQACVLAAELPADIGHLHAHFLHTPSSVARYAAKMRALPWSVSAHAVDIWTSPEWEKREKLEDAAFCVTCTAFGHDHLAALVAQKNTVFLNYHGLDFERFPPPEHPFAPDRDGSAPERAVEILSVGRAVEKKGFDLLLEALSQLPEDLHWRFNHIGGDRKGPITSLPPTGRPTCSCLPAGSQATATATGYPMSCSKPRASPCRCYRPWCRRCPSWSLTGSRDTLFPRATSTPSPRGWKP
jgi:glycosyltransferase involved in cell wall biosynthesis